MNLLDFFFFFGVHYLHYFLVSGGEPIKNNTPADSLMKWCTLIATSPLSGITLISRACYSEYLIWLNANLILQYLMAGVTFAE